MYELRLLGRLDLRDSGGQELPSVLSHSKHLAVLSYLVVECPGGFVTRDRLLALLWGESDTDHARNSMNQAVHALRRDLGDTVLPGRGRRELGLDSDALWCDVPAFEDAFACRDAARAMELYGGDFLSGFHLPNAPDFEHWMEGHRLRLRAMAGSAGWHRAHQQLEEGHPAEAERTAIRAMELAATDESPVREFVRALAGAGDRVAAVRFYERFARSLEEELDLAPSEETRRVVEHIRRGPPSGTSQRVWREVPAPTALRTPSKPPPDAGEAALDGEPVGTPGPDSAGARGTRPRTRRLSGWWAGAMTTLGLFVAAIAYLGRAPSESRRPVIAVLPFENLSPDPGDAYFAAGLQEDLTSKLGRIPSVAVVARFSVAGYADPVGRPPHPEIAAEVGADFLVTGSARPAGGSVRATVTLIEGPTGVHLWARDFDAGFSPENYVRIQAEIVQRIASELRAAVSPDDLEWLRAVPTESMEALEAYLRGNELYWHSGKGVTDSWEMLPWIPWFESAVEHDPEFSLALARLALSGVPSFRFTASAPDSTMLLARRALAITPGLPEARLALAASLMALGQQDSARAVLRDLDDTASNDPDMGLEVTELLRDLGDFDDAIDAYERLERRYPKDPRIKRELQYSYMHAHRYDDALSVSKRLEAIVGWPTGGLLHREAFIHVARGQRAEAEAAIAELLRVDPRYFYGYVNDGPQRVVERLLRTEQRPGAFEAAVGSVLTEEHDRGFFLSNAAIHEAAMGRRERARVYWDSVRIECLRHPTSGATNWVWAADYLNGLSMAYLGLEEKERAIATARRMVGEFLDSDCRTTFQAGFRACALLARIYAHFGEPDAALDVLEQLLPAPSWLTVPILRTDPVWAPLWDHPGFQALLERHADDAEH